MEDDLAGDMAAQLVLGEEADEAAPQVPAAEFSVAAAGGLLADAWPHGDLVWDAMGMEGLLADDAEPAAGGQLELQPHAEDQAAAVAAPAGRRVVKPLDLWALQPGQALPTSCRLAGCLNPLGADQAAGKPQQRTVRYSRRQGVCMEHLRAPEVELEGFRLRFCQKCSKLEPRFFFKDAQRSCAFKLAQHALGQRLRYYEYKAGRVPARRRRARAAGVDDPPPGDVDVDAAAAGADGHAAAAMQPQQWAGGNAAAAPPQQPWAGGAAAAPVQPAWAHGHAAAAPLPPWVHGMPHDFVGAPAVHRMHAYADHVQETMQAWPPLLPVPQPPPTGDALFAAYMQGGFLQPQQPAGPVMPHSPSINEAGSPSSGGLSGLAQQMGGLMAAPAGSDSDDVQRRTSADSVGRPPLPPPTASQDAVQQSLLGCAGPACMGAGAAAPHALQQAVQAAALVAAAIAAAESRAKALHAEHATAHLKMLQALAVNGLGPMPGFMPQGPMAPAMAPPLAPPQWPPGMLQQLLLQYQHHQQLAMAAAAAAAAAAAEAEAEAEAEAAAHAALLQQEREREQAAKVAEETARVAAIAGFNWPGLPPPPPPPPPPAAMQ